MFTRINDPTTLQALDVREALDLAEDPNLKHMHVASACKVVVDELNHGKLATYGAVLREISEHSSSFFNL